MTPEKLAAAALLVFALVAPPRAAVAGSYGLFPDESQLTDQVREPLFAFIFQMTERDSLGTWTAEDLAAFAAQWGNPSVFPIVANLVSLSREVVPDNPPPRIRDAVCRRRWVAQLRPQRVEVPMPYRILGYRPGTLSFGGPLVLQEWRLGARHLQLELPAGKQEFDVHGLTIYQVAQGWLVLDVDAWLDRLLGDLLEDAALEGFVVGRLDGQLVGVGNSASRTGRRIFGEFDFRTGTVLGDSRAQALAMSRFGRIWTRPPGHDHREVWRVYGK